MGLFKKKAVVPGYRIAEEELQGGFV